MCSLIVHYSDNPLLVLLFQKPSKFGNNMQKEGRNVSCYSPTGFSTNLSSQYLKAVKEGRLEAGDRWAPGSTVLPCGQKLHNSRNFTKAG